MLEIKDWEVGEKYRLIIEVEMKSKSEREEMIEGSFDISAYKHLKPKSPEEMDDEEFGEYQGKKLSGQ